MFVCCLVRDEKFAAKMRWDEEAQNYAYLADCLGAKSDAPSDASKELYKFAFIEQSVSCQNRVMRRELLEKSVYARWLDYGTLHAVTHHSFVVVTGEIDSLQATVINPFLTQYVDMARVVLAQRATILALCAKASALAKRFDSGKTTTPLMSEVVELHEKYVQAQSQVLLFELTAQEQGVELFALLTEQLYVAQNRELLDGQLHNLYEISGGRIRQLQLKADEEKADADRRLDRKMSLVAVIGLVWTVVQCLGLVLTHSAAGEWSFDWKYTLVLSGFVLVFVLGFWLIMFRRNCKRK
jgi:hypothetical protein